MLAPDPFAKEQSVVAMTSGAFEIWFSGVGRPANGSTPPGEDSAPADGRPVLFCLAHAGGGATVFNGWAEALAPEVEALAIQLPGRERRISEPLGIDPAEIATAVAAGLAARGMPGYGFYGHSLGGRLAFEVIRELRRSGGPMPARLYIGAARPPDVELPEELRGLPAATDDVIAKRLVRLGGIPPEVFDYPELLNLVIQVIRADFEWLDNYVYQPEPPLAVPIIGFVASNDQMATAPNMAGWVRHTSAGLTMRQVTANHLFVQDLRDQLTAFIRTDLLAAATASRGLA